MRIRVGGSVGFAAEYDHRHSGVVSPKPRDRVTLLAGIREGLHFFFSEKFCIIEY